MAGVGCLTFKLSAIKSERQTKAAGFISVKLYFKGKNQGNRVITSMITQKLFLKYLYSGRIQLLTLEFTFMRLYMYFGFAFFSYRISFSHRVKFNFSSLAPHKQQGLKIPYYICFVLPSRGHLQQKYEATRGLLSAPKKKTGKQYDKTNQNITQIRC